MILGIDVSSYFEEKAAGAVYYIDGKSVDPLKIFKEQGISVVRIRLWLDPYAEDGTPYMGGTCDLANFIKLAKLANEYGFKIMLDFHYSDFWCDPSKQMIPKAWKHLTAEELPDAIYNYTVATLKEIREEGIELAYIQIGNEITNGTLWPLGKLEYKDDPNHRSNYPTFISFIKAGVKGAREIYPESKLIIHLERSYDNKIYREFFDEFTANHVDFDIIGASYYPYWHHTFKELFDNLDDMKKRYGKEVMIVETGYAFTLENFIAEYGKLVIDENFILENNLTLEYPISYEGQAAFIENLIKEAKKHDIAGILYWEPLWLPTKGICWSSTKGEEYIKEEGKPTRNEWANQCLYDYSGNATPALYKFTIK